ncbi:MAG: DUF4255 domain-containing protein [bacterium]|nr:DUF4255 domain-containing protein [bacterium]
MSDYPVIADVGETLKKFLWERFRADDRIYPDIIGAEDDIALLPPDHPDVGTTKKLSVYLYRLVENTYLRNRQREAQTGSPGILDYPPLTMDLYYIVTPDTGDRQMDHLLVGKVLQVLYDHGTISGSVLTGASLEGTDTRLRVVLSSPNFDESIQLWQAFSGKSFKLSLCYLVTPIAINSSRDIEVQRVLQLGENWEQVSAGSVPNG